MPRSVLKGLFQTFGQEGNFVIKKGSHIQNQFLFMDAGEDGRISLSQLFFQSVDGEVRGFNGEDDRWKLLKRKGPSSHL
jgi:hypothetical protein